MNQEMLVNVENVSKKFCSSLNRSLWYGIKDISNEIIGKKNSGVLRKDEFWAVKDISFELKRGECLGLIGANGAGKSTLLKMLNGLVKPDNGKITMHGRVGALIELGAGFNPILTGRENIFINGAVLGLTSREIEKNLDSIVSFAGIDEFIDSPVNMYSSGMKVRLGFAVASHLEADILLIDEVLAVGDAAFRTRCLNKISQLAKTTAIIFVSHTMPLVGKISTKAMLMAKGKKVLQDDDVVVNIQEYLKDNREATAFVSGENTIELISLNVLSGGLNAGLNTIQMQQFDDFIIVLHLRIKKSINEALINIAFFDQEEKNVAEAFSIHSEFLIQKSPGDIIIKAHFEKFCLNTGKYHMQLGIVENQSNGVRGEIYYINRGLLALEIIGTLHGYAPVQLNPAWSVN